MVFLAKKKRVLKKKASHLIKRPVRKKLSTKKKHVANKKVVSHKKHHKLKPIHYKHHKVKLVHHKHHKAKAVHHKHHFNKKLVSKSFAHHKIREATKHIFYAQKPPVVLVRPDVNELISKGFTPKEIISKYKSTPTDFALCYVHPKNMLAAGFSLEEIIEAGRTRWNSPIGLHSSNYNETFNLCGYLAEHRFPVKRLIEAGAKLNDLAVGAVSYKKLRDEGFKDKDILNAIKKHFSESDNSYHWAHKNYARLREEGMPAEAFLDFESVDFLAKNKVPLNLLVKKFSPSLLMHYFKPLELISEGVSLRKMDADNVSLYWAFQNGVPLSVFKKEGFSVIELVSREHDGYLFQHYAPLAREFPEKQIEEARNMGFDV